MNVLPAGPGPCCNNPAASVGPDRASIHRHPRRRSPREIHVRGATGRRRGGDRCAYTNFSAICIAEAVIFDSDQRVPTPGETLPRYDTIPCKDCLSPAAGSATVVVFTTTVPLRRRHPTWRCLVRLQSPRDAAQQKSKAVTARKRLILESPKRRPSRLSRRWKQQPAHCVVRRPAW